MSKNDSCTKKLGYKNLGQVEMKKIKKVIVVQDILLRSKSENTKEKKVNYMIVVVIHVYTAVKILLTK